MTGRTLLGSMLVGLLAWLAIFACSLSAIWGYHQAFGATTVCPHSRTQTARVSCLVKAVRWHAKNERHLHHKLAARSPYTAAYAIRLASAAFGVPAGDMRRIARCESGMGAQVTAEAGSGASGLFQFLGSTWRRTPFATFDVFDPVANALAAAQLVVHDGGWHEWSCSSITGVR